MTFCKIDASEIAPVIDRSLSEWTPENLRQAYLDYGCAIVRGAVLPDLLCKVHAAIDAAYARTKDVHVYDRDLKAVTAGALTGYEIVGDPKLKQFLDLVFCGQWLAGAALAASRLSNPSLPVHRQFLGTVSGLRD
jgi:hypothetical protein